LPGDVCPDGVKDIRFCKINHVLWIK